jgi:hypothetical protein
MFSKERDGLRDAERPGGAVGRAAIGAAQFLPASFKRLGREEYIGLEVVSQVRDIQDQTRAVSAAGDDRTAVGRECDRVDRRAVSVEPPDLLRPGQVPDTDRRVFV